MIKQTQITRDANYKKFKDTSKMGRPKKKRKYYKFTIPKGGWFNKKNMNWQQVRHYNLQEMPKPYLCSSCQRRTYYIDKELGMPVCSIQCQNKLHKVISTKQSNTIKKPRGEYE